MNPLDGSEALSHTEDAVYEDAQDLTPKSRVLTIIGLIFALILAFGGIYMMGQAFEYGEEWGAWLFGGGIVVDALGFWLAFYLVPKLDGDRVLQNN